jgi:hypothetical protein
MFRTTAPAAALALVFVAAACASTGERRSGVSSSVITQEEIAESHANNAYDLIQSLRSHWLNVRGQSTLGTTTGRSPVDGGQITTMVGQDIPVYLDGTRIGGVETLRSLSIRGLSGMQRLGAGEATQRFGSGHPNGAILITSR